MIIVTSQWISKYYVVTVVHDAMLDVQIADKLK